MFGILCRQFLVESDLFIYCGHGAGEKYLHRDKALELSHRAVAVLMGCSSGHLKVCKDFFLTLGACFANFSHPTG